MFFVLGLQDACRVLLRLASCPESPLDLVTEALEQLLLSASNGCSNAKGQPGTAAAAAAACTLPEEEARKQGGGSQTSPGTGHPAVVPVLAATQLLLARFPGERGCMTVQLLLRAAMGSCPSKVGYGCWKGREVCGV